MYVSMYMYMHTRLRFQMYNKHIYRSIHAFLIIIGIDCISFNNIKVKQS